MTNREWIQNADAEQLAMFLEGIVRHCTKNCAYYYRRGLRQEGGTCDGNHCLEGYKLWLEFEHKDE